MASNKTTSTQRILIERARFDSRVVGQAEGTVPSWESKKIKDFIGTEKIFYGRINHLNESIILKTENIKPLDTKGNVLALNFVADAFKTLNSRFQAAINSGQVKGDFEVYSSFSAEKGFLSPVREYKAHSRLLIDSFVPFIASRKDEIRSFKTFFPFLREFLTTRAEEGNPITKSFFMKSNILSPLSSGLMIEIYNGDYSDDVLKNSMFYSQRDFRFFKDLAYQHGFMIDKHIPWRLVADIKSPNMERYIKRYLPFTMNYGLFFPKFYEKATKLDFNTMLSLATAVYNKFVSQYPLIEPDSCEEPKLEFRQMISREEVLASRVSVEEWLDLYTRVRAAETQIGYEEATINRIVQNALDLTNSLDIVKGMGYINDKFDNVEHFGGSLFYDVTRYGKSEDPDAVEEDVSETVLRSVQKSNFGTY